MSLHDNTFSRCDTIGVCGKVGVFLWGESGKVPRRRPKQGKQGKSGLPGTRKLSLWRNFGVISVENPTGLFDRGLWEALGKFYLSTEFPAAFPHVHTLQKRGKSLILPCRRGILEKSTKDFRTPCVKLRFFHTLFNRLWKSPWKIHKEGMICGDFLWETKEFCTATNRRQIVFFDRPMSLYQSFLESKTFFTKKVLAGSKGRALGKAWDGVPRIRRA